MTERPIVVERWPSEDPLFVLSVVVGIVGWIVLFITIIGAAYAVMFGLFFGLIHLISVAQVRGSAVRLGPNQFPELYAAVERMARRMDMPVPETYLMQAGGSLNAFATRFLRAHIVVLFSDLLEACGSNVAARDMIIAHELGHIKSGHLRWRWLLLPSGLVPFLGSALSRAREFTCDRYGLAGAGDKEGAGIGLAILAAGAKHGPLVNRAELVRQQETTSRSGFMTLGEWFGSHPPLAKRIAQIDPALAAGAQTSRAGAVRAGLAVAAIPAAGIAASIFVIGASDVFQKFKSTMDSVAAVQQAGGIRPDQSESDYTPPPDAAERAQADIVRLAAFVESERARGALPWNVRELYSQLATQFPRAEPPRDPYDDSDYGYEQRGQHFMLWSSGPDGMSWTEDDIRYDSRVRKIVEGTQPASPVAPRP